MKLFFQIGNTSWICVRKCIDWNDAVNQVYYWNVSNCRCINEHDFNKLDNKNNFIVMNF